MKTHVHWFISMSMACIVAGLFFVAIRSYYNRVHIVTADVIASDIKKLISIFGTINKQCGIIGFDEQQNVINFLNVGTFSGSEVGAMNVMHPNRWKGPYLKDNLSVQGIEYMVVRTDKGYFITPGNGVKLPNDKIVGKDLVLDKHADIKKLAHDVNGLYYNHRALAGYLMPLNSKGAIPKELWSIEE